MGFFKKLFRGAGKVLKKVAAPAAGIVANAVTGGLATRAVSLGKQLGMRIGGRSHDTMGTSDQAALVKAQGGKALRQKVKKKLRSSVMAEVHDLSVPDYRDVIAQDAPPPRKRRVKVPAELKLSTGKPKRAASPAQQAARERFAAAARARAAAKRAG